MGTDISGIAKNILLARAGIKVNTSSDNTEEDMTVSFMELMNQNNLSASIDVSAESAKMDLTVGTENATKTAYDTNAGTAKSISVKETQTPEEMREEASEPLEDYEEEVRSVLKEELGVTDEEISAAMENLGMSFLDLRNLQNLTTLIQTLTNEDVGTLFLSDAFQNVMEQVTALTEDLCAELGITREELDVLCETWKQTEAAETGQAEMVEPEVVQPETVNEEATSEIPEETNNAVEVSKTDKAAEPMETVVVQREEEQPEQTVAGKEAKETNDAAKQTETLEQTAKDMQEESGKESGEESGEQNLFDHAKDTKPDTVNTGVNLTGQQSVRTEEFAIPQENVQPYSQVDANDIIQQIARNVRMTISAATTSMEMQLNPEHLGKIYLNISEREGVIRAQIATQNENVKELLETQLVELRQSLNQQGIKVDAIEITVATHEFEQNLEENAKQDEQMQQQMEETQKQAKRNLNLSELDGLSGLLTEEEQLAAQIMRDNGNQVDLTA